MAKNPDYFPVSQKYFQLINIAAFFMFVSLLVALVSTFVIDDKKLRVQSETRKLMQYKQYTDMAIYVIIFITLMRFVAIRTSEAGKVCAG